MKRCRALGLLSLCLTIPVFIACSSVGPFADLSAVAEGIEALFPRSIQLEGVPVIAQPTASTCAITTVAITASFLRGEPIEPSTLITEYEIRDDRGLDSQQFLSYLELELPGYSVAYVEDAGSGEYLALIHHQLDAGIPVPILFGAANPYNEPYFDFHASVVDGLDLDRELVSISNAYGFHEEIGLVEFLNRAG